MPEETELWIWNRQTNAWHPPIFMGRNAEQLIDVSRGGKAYLAMKDSRKRDIPIGWVDLHDYAKTHDHVGLRPLYHAQGWLTAWTVGDGELVPTGDRWGPRMHGGAGDTVEVR
jgi:hypothetical protein